MTKESLATVLRCPLCRGDLRLGDEIAQCREHSFPVEGGIPRLLPPDLMDVRHGAGRRDLRSRTYQSFGFEWTRFSRQLPAYEANFRWYLEPLPERDLRGQRILDAGCGMGRHTYHFLRAGAEVIALDASPAVEAAAKNNEQGSVLFLQGDLLQLPLADSSFDVVCCFGVLHHIEGTSRGLAELVRVLRPGGWLLIYLYHDPAEFSRTRGALLSLVSAARMLTTRLPLRVLRSSTWWLAAALYLGYVGPSKMLSRMDGLGKHIRSLPLGQYVDYPFAVLWNDQFDRFSAPLERRFRRSEVESLLGGAGLTDVRMLGGYGWRTAGRKAGVS